MSEKLYSPVEIFDLLAINGAIERKNARAALNKFRNGTSYTYKSGEKRVKKSVGAKLTEGVHYIDAPCPTCGHNEVRYTETGLEKIKALWKK